MIVTDSSVGPAMVAYAAVGSTDPVLMNHQGSVSTQLSEVPAHQCSLIFRDQIVEVGANKLLLGHAEIFTIGMIHKKDGPIRAIAADQCGQIFDYRLQLLLAVAQRLLRLYVRRDVS